MSNITFLGGLQELLLVSKIEFWKRSVFLGWSRLVGSVLVWALRSPTEPYGALRSLAPRNPTELYGALRSPTGLTERSTPGPYGALRDPTKPYGALRLNCDRNCDGVCDSNVGSDPLYDRDNFAHCSTSSVHEYAQVHTSKSI